MGRSKQQNLRIGGETQPNATQLRRCKHPKRVGGSKTAGSWVSDAAVPACWTYEQPRHIQEAKWAQTQTTKLIFRSKKRRHQVSRAWSTATKKSPEDAWANKHDLESVQPIHQLWRLGACSKVVCGDWLRLFAPKARISYRSSNGNSKVWQPDAEWNVERQPLEWLWEAGPQDALGQVPQAQQTGHWGKRQEHSRPEVWFEGLWTNPWDCGGIQQVQEGQNKLSKSIQTWNAQRDPRASNVRVLAR